MNVTLYKELIQVLDSLPVPSVCFDRETFLQELYPQIPVNTIESIVQYQYQVTIKKTHFNVKKQGDTIYYRFLRALQEKQEKAAFNLSLEFESPPYLISQLLLENHFSKHWEDGSSAPPESTGAISSTTSNVKRIKPVQVNFDEEFPSLNKKTCVKEQRRVVPTAVANTSRPDASNIKSAFTQQQQPQQHWGHRSKHKGSANTSVLSLSDVMVIKTRKNKKNNNKSNSSEVKTASIESGSNSVASSPGSCNSNLVQISGTCNSDLVQTPGTCNSDLVQTPGNCNSNLVQTPGTCNSDLVQTSGTCNSNLVQIPGTCNSDLVQILIQDKAKSKLFDRMLNKQILSPANKEKTCIENNNNCVRKATCVAKEVSVDDETNNNHLSETPKKLKIIPTNKRKSPKKFVFKRLEDFQYPKTPSPDQSDVASNETNTKPTSSNRAARKRMEPVSHNDHTLSSIHFMTQNCHSKEELYEGYRKKLELLNQRFVDRIKVVKQECSLVNSENRNKIEKLTQRMNSKGKTSSKVYLNVMEEPARSKVWHMLLEKMRQGEAAVEEKQPNEVLLSASDLQEWKRLLRTLRDEPQSLVTAVSLFWKKFTRHLKTPNGPKDFLKQMLRNPALITDPILSQEITYNNAMDDQYGPIIDLYRRSLGVEYENKVMSYLSEHNISIKSEKLCMCLSFDKTPDVLIVPPMTIHGQPVNWIESKAVFGNDENHAMYEKNQYQPYYQRFGPGCVIYWFGYLDTIKPRPGEYIILDQLPASDIISQSSHEDMDAEAFLEKYSGVIFIDLERLQEKEKQEEEEERKQADKERNHDEVCDNKIDETHKTREGKEIDKELEDTTHVTLPPVQCNDITSGEDATQINQISSSCTPSKAVDTDHDSPTASVLTLSRRVSGGFMCSTPVKATCNVTNMRGNHHVVHTKPYLVANDDVNSSECEPVNNFETSISGSSVMSTESPVMSSDQSLMSTMNDISTCSMCDLSLQDKSVCSESRGCVNDPRCFSSQCTDKLFGYQSSPVCNCRDVSSTIRAASVDSDLCVSMHMPIK